VSRYRSIPLRLALFALALSVMLTLAQSILTALNGSNGDRHVLSEVTTTLGYLAFSTVGFVILLHQPRNAVGWICASIGLSGHLLGFSTAYSMYTYQTHPGALPFAPLMSWLEAWTWVPSIALPLTMLLLLFPNGRFLSPRWRRVGVAAIWAIALLILTAMLLDDESRAGENPLVWDPIAPIALVIGSLALAALLVIFIASVVSALLRFKRSTGVQRQQMKWFTLAVGVNIVLQPANLILFADDSENTMFGIGVVFLALAIGSAVLRRGLYEIDRIINRTLVYGSLSAATVGLYLALVVAFGWLARTIAGQGSNELAVAATTLIVAALFQPARRRIQAVVDRRFYRARYDARRIAETFQARLRDQTDIDDVRAGLAAAVTSALQPTAVHVWLRDSTGGQQP